MWHMGRRAKVTSFDLGTNMRNRTTGDATIKAAQIIESLTRNGDYFIVPPHKVRSVRRRARIEGIKIRIMKNGDKYRIDRLLHLWRPEENLEPDQIASKYETEIINLSSKNKELISYCNRFAYLIAVAMQYFPPAIIEESTSVLDDYENYLNKN